MEEENSVMENLDSENIVDDDSKDLAIEDCQKHMDAVMLTEVARYEGEKTTTVWAGQEWKKYV